MRQENGLKGRILNILRERIPKGWFIRRTATVNKKNRSRLRVKPYRLLAVALGAAMVFMLSRFPQKAVSLERQREQLTRAAEAYLDAQSINNQLTAELASVDSADFIERTARREYGYCWYGETVYEVGNLDEVLAGQELEVYGAP